MLEALYKTPWQHPGVAFFCGALTILFSAFKLANDARKNRRAFIALLAILQGEILLDATLTGALSPLREGSFLSTAFSIAFVIFGDARYFYIVERQRASRKIALLFTLLFALPVPILTGIGQEIFPQFLSGNRLFLTYELCLLVCLCIHFSLRVRGFFGLALFAYVRRLFYFEVVQYALWSVADVGILFGSDFGFGLRMIPNFLYYAAFVPLAIFSVPDEARP